MKKLLIILGFIPLFLMAQNPPPPNEHGLGGNVVGGRVATFLDGYRIQPSTIVLVYFGGIFKGYGDVLNYHYPSFKRLHPNANDQWWNPDLAWTNKYKNGIPPEPKFWGSKTIFVDLTTADHAAYGLSKYCMIGAVCIKIGEKGKPIKHYLLDALIYTAVYNAGFWTVYELAYKSK